MVDQAVKEVLLPAAKGMIRNKTPFTGILYAGLIATNDDRKSSNLMRVLVIQKRKSC